MRYFRICLERRIRTGKTTYIRTRVTLVLGTAMIANSAALNCIRSMAVRQLGFGWAIDERSLERVSKDVFEKHTSKLRALVEGSVAN